MATSEIPKQVTNALEQIVLAETGQKPRQGTSGGAGYTLSFHVAGEGWKVHGRPIPYDHLRHLRARSPSAEGQARLMWDYINGVDVGVAPEVREQVLMAMEEVMPELLAGLGDNIRGVVREELSELGLWSAEPAPFEESATTPAGVVPPALDDEGNPVSEEPPKEEPKTKTTRKKTAPKKAAESTEG